MAERALRIGQVAARSGISRKALRLYWNVLIDVIKSGKVGKV